MERADDGPDARPGRRVTVFQLPEEPDIGPMFRKMRNHYKFTQKQLAEKIGCTLSTMKYIETPCKKSRTYGRKGAGVKLITVRNCLRAFGLELTITTSDEFVPVYNRPQKKFWKLTNTQRVMAEMYVAGDSIRRIAERLGRKDLRDIYHDLKKPNVAAYVESLKYEAFMAAVLSWSNKMVEASGVAEELHAERMKVKAQKLHEISAKRWVKTKTRRKTNRRTQPKAI